jgi:pseudaminic acid synthase
MKIGNFDINEEARSFIIAELSANHNGSLEIAKESIRAAKRAGADCIKFQTYTADTITLNHRSNDFKITQGTKWDGRYLYDLYQEAYTPWEWHEELFKECKKNDLISFSSPFDFTAVDFLEELDVPAYKIASFEITDIPLIEYVASKKKPVIISTGIAKLEDIELAIKACHESNNDQIALLKCTSSYPAPFNGLNLSVIKDLRDKFGVICGLSDHTIGSTAPIIAIAMGAKIIEKHFIIDKSVGGHDSHFSMDEKDFTLMVKAIRDAEDSIGNPTYDLTEKQLKSREHSRSLYISKEIKKGDVFSKDNIRSIRPGYGLHPKYFNEVIGKPSLKDISKGEPLKIHHFKKNI